MITRRISVQNISFCRVLAREEPNDYTQHWKTIGELEKISTCGLQLVRKSNGDKNENTSKTSNFLFATKLEISFCIKTFENRSDNFKSQRNDQNDGFFIGWRIKRKYNGICVR